MYRIGEISKLSGIKVPTIRYFEQIGLLNAPDRNEGNQRLYSEEKLKRLKFIKRGRELGFSQNELKALLGINGEGKPSCSEVLHLTHRHIQVVREKIEDLQAIEKSLLELTLKCEKQRGSNCPAIDSLHSSIH